MKNFKRIISIILMMALVITLVPTTTASASASKTYITIKYFNSLLMKASGSTESFIKDGEFKDTSKNITVSQALLLADRAYDAKNGSDLTEDEKSKYNYVTDYTRIKDLSKAPKAHREAIIRCYVRGLFIGSSAGNWTKQRVFKPTENLTKSAALTVVNRIKGSKGVAKLSYDAQVIRTKNLPKNAKYYSYILDGVPNSYYDSIPMYFMQTGFENAYKKGEYAYPKDVSKITFTGFYGETIKFSDRLIYKDAWIKKIETNVKTRFSYNYKKSGTDWLNTLNNTYYQYNDSAKNNKRVNAIKDWMAYAKKNKIIWEVKDVFADASSMYYTQGNIWVRVHAKVRVKQSNKVMNGAEFLGFGMDGGIRLDGFKVGKWIEVVTEFQISEGGEIKYDNWESAAIDNENDVFSTYLMNNAKSRTNKYFK